MKDTVFSAENSHDSRLDTLLSAEMLEWAKVNGNDFARLMAYYKCAMMEIETKFNVLNVEYSLKLDRNPISNIQTRLKSPTASLKSCTGWAERLPSPRWRSTSPTWRACG